MIRVLHLISGLRVGGAERLLLDILRRVPREELAIEVASLLGPCDLGRDFEREGFPVLDLSREGRFSWRCAGALRRVLRCQPRTILHTHLMHAQLIGRWLRWRGHASRLVSTQHFSPLERIAGPVGRLHRLTARMEDATVAISQSVADDLRTGLHVPPERIRVIENGIELRRFHPAVPAMSREALGCAVGDTLIGVTASLTPKKGVDLLVRAFAQVAADHPSARLMIAGDGPERSGLTALAVELGVQGAVRFLGSIEDVPGFLRALDLFCLCSRREAFGLSVAEAMAVGCPVVHTAVPGLASLTEHGVTALQVPTEDPAALAEAIRRLLGDRALAQRIREEAQRRAHERFGIERTVAGYTRLWREMAG